MKNNKITYKAKFGNLTLYNGPKNDFYWVAIIDSSNDLFCETIPINIFTKDKKILKEPLILSKE